MAVPAEVATLLLTKTGTVYTEGSSSGLFDVVAKTGLRCNLLTVNLAAAPTSAARAELAAERTLVWEADYVMPAYCQVVIDGTTWDPVDINAFDALPGPDGTTAFRRVPVRKAA